MGLCLIVLPFLMLVDILRRAPGGRRSFREAVLVASLVFGGLLAAATECLGFLKFISASSIAGFWALTGLVLLPLWLQRLGLGESRAGWRRSLAELTAGDMALLGLTLACVLITGVIAFLAPPNTWDSMTYHMSRVMHWIQNRSVDHYATGIGRQLFVNPFSEYVILHFYLLAGSDRFANFVQWLSYVGSLLGVSLIARELGADRRGQILAVVAAASIPMAILQSTSTQTDLVVTFWGVCCVAFFLRWRATQDPFHWLCLGLAAGLVALAKSTGIFVLAPFGAWALLAGFRRQGARFLVPALACTLLVVLLVTPFLVRNIRTFGNPLGADEVVEETNHLDAGYKTAVSSVVLNLGLHFGSASETVNRFLQEKVVRLHGVLGVPVPRRFAVGPSTSEDYAGNFRHLVLYAGAVLLLLGRWKREPVLLLYGGCLVLGFVLQSVVLGWSPWRSRYHTILFVLAAPLLGLVAGRWRFRRLCLAGFALLLLTSAPWFLENCMKPLFGSRSVASRPRVLQYFVLRPDLFKPYVQAAELIRARSPRNIGLIIGADSWEYPFWVLLDPLGNHLRMEHIRCGAGIPEALLAGSSFQPDAILASTPDPQPERMVYRDIVFRRAMQYRRVAVFFPDVPGEASGAGTP